ncbi:MAG: hypothetical protein HGA59_07920 [Chlorobiaceae bacterium]|jgi:hypothetical protein|nr:hypothetical protein [Chlorobiaceae bacterium]NTV17478.1 hypothetical protein [Chlorobiaceae bacterium]
MKFSAAFRKSFFCFVICCLLSGCSEDTLSRLDKDDIHFAGFYSDYLLKSGVVTDNEDIVLAALDAADINELLVRHALTRESLKSKIEKYKKNPELWRLVLVQVRANIVKKTDAGQ